MLKKERRRFWRWISQKFSVQYFNRPAPGDYCCEYILYIINTTWKVWVFGVLLVRIFSHSDCSVSPRVHYECGKVWTRITPNTETFYSWNLYSFQVSFFEWLNKILHKWILIIFVQVLLKLGYMFILFFFL